MIPTTTGMEPFGGLENCACCGAITTRWTALWSRTPGEQVACCKGCARSKTPSDVPTKAAWFAAARRFVRKETSE